jgi:hypothetical protein
MVIKYISIFQSKALKNFPKLGIFWFENKPSGSPVLTPFAKPVFSVYAEIQLQNEGTIFFTLSTKFLPPNDQNS